MYGRPAIVAVAAVDGSLAMDDGQEEFDGQE